MKRYQISLVIKEIQIKIWDINSQIRLLQLRRLTIPSLGKVIDPQESLYIADDNITENNS